MLLLLHFNYKFFRGWENSPEDKPLIHFSIAPFTGIYEENCQEIVQETHGWELQGGLNPAAVWGLGNWNSWLPGWVRTAPPLLSRWSTFPHPSSPAPFSSLLPSKIILNQDVLVSKTHCVADNFHELSGLPASFPAPRGIKHHHHQQQHSPVPPRLSHFSHVVSMLDWAPLLESILRFLYSIIFKTCFFTQP